ncbi:MULTISPECIES: Ger(x)C family spore germination protein [unclassified Bacillus (in: firmicutes)]|uniref:Ger(x)C family spore germination protein n=1 Tax=unclassified Bacillus (in: firmicutes) TaxID=185979 RepID=UPI000404005D|nr:Ger(x)C family spore germination protein [Bacillus sp. NSP9.1]QHZ47205.1 Ger(x)C family spore germination protein [Bacillus sp. NSP9.1]
MRKHIGLVAVLILSVIVLSGCWNRRELNQLAIVGAMAIDKADGKHVVTTQVIDPSQIAAKQGKGQEAPVITYKEKGDTIFEAIRRMTTVTPRKLYFSHLRVLVIGEEIAKEGIDDTLDFLSRDHEVRPDFFIIVAKDARAENVLKVMTGIEDIPANKLYTSLETSEKSWAPSMTITLDKLISDITSEGIQPHLTGLKLLGDVKKGQDNENVQQIDPDVKLKYGGLAVFKSDRLIGWLNERDSKAVNYALGNVKSTIGEQPCPNGKGKVAVEVVRAKSELAVDVKNGSPKGSVQINVEGNIGEIQCKLDLMKSKTITELENNANKRVKMIIENAIKTAQKEYKVDFFGFGEALHRSNPDYWKKVKKNWDETFSEMPIDVKTDVQIRRVGTIGKSPLEKME